VDPHASWTYDPNNGSGLLTHYDQTRKTELLDFYLNYVKDLSGISSRIDLTAGYSCNISGEKVQLIRPTIMKTM